ncbi:hypothetical protein D5086_000667 [Populus alba]|uniref:Uncharacterized protein n=1 Tax=Populus alba TaxID=43335 RepID=A0ACC4CWH8_POPAL
MTTKSKPVKVPPSEAAFHLSLTLFLKLRSAISLASSEQLIRLSLNWKHVCDSAECLTTNFSHGTHNYILVCPAALSGVNRR